MKNISILNDVLGPVMRGPSSSHTAASYHLGALARFLLGETPREAEIVFDSGGSYAKVYREQGSDLAFATGLFGWPITDERFSLALQLAPAEGLDIRFSTEAMPGADHPNTVRIRLHGDEGSRLSLLGRSIGGGAVEITELEGWPVLIDGAAFQVFVEIEADAEPRVRQMLSDAGSLAGISRHEREGLVLLGSRRRLPLAEASWASLATVPGVRRIWTATPLMFVKQGRQLFASAAEMLALCDAQGLSAGQAALAYEAELLGISERNVTEEMMRRFGTMRDAVERGLRWDLPPMQLLRPSAAAVFEAEAQGDVAVGGIHARAAARALAAMHVNCGMGVVCAAPTAGSAGVLPAVMTTLHAELGVPPEDIARCLLAAGAIGVIVAERATFAAEVAGCQVEIGAAAAMAAAAVVEAAHGTARQAADAAAVSFQNTMGSVCDLVQGIVEVPCHTRNALGASAAMVVADLVLGGYENPVPLDETIDAVYSVGRMLPAELRVTALGGLALAPSARALRRLR